jgi:hypothetical protein
VSANGSGSAKGSYWLSEPRVSVACDTGTINGDGRKAQRFGWDPCRVEGERGAASGREKPGPRRLGGDRNDWRLARKKSVRTIDVDEETIALLREQHEQQRFDRRAWGTAYRADLDLVFCRPGGSPEDPNKIGRHFARRVGDLATLPAIALHGLRHTHATLLLEAGVDVKTVSERLGHDSAQTTLELYGHVTPRMRSNAAVRFGLLLTTARTAPASALTAENRGVDTQRVGDEPSPRAEVCDLPVTSRAKIAIRRVASTDF